MFTKDDEKYLIRQIGNNQVILFLGAGFSRGAKNRLGEDFPTGWGLGDKMWNFLRYEGDYDDTPLTQMYQAFLLAGIKKQQKKDFLENNLLSGEISDNYDLISVPFWFKIYTINIDDVVSKTYKKVGKPIEEIKYPLDQYSERDQSLETTQIIYLNGKLPCEPDEVIFSTQQYAKAQLYNQPLYSQFVYDYASLPTVFIGTELDEPLFERYIEAREGKYGYRELRPKSFLITPKLSPVKIDNLKNNYNVTHVGGTTQDFFEWLECIKTQLPVRKEILKKTFPNLLSILEYADISGISNKTLLEFSKAFNRVPKEFVQLKERSGFLSGTSPRWNDLVRELDIPRTITKQIFGRLESILDEENAHQKIDTISIIGSAGAGKSTLLKRLGLMLSQSGRTVFLSYSDFIPKTSKIIDVLRTIDEQVILMFDNAKNVLNQLPSLLKEFNNELKHVPVIILAIRTNFSNRLEQYLPSDIVNNTRFQIPDLDDIEIKNLISLLDEHNLLGILKGRTPDYRFKEFKYRAHRQILIAMKEATKGKSFEDIIIDEYSAIDPLEAKTLCICIALNTELGFTNSKQDLIGFSKVTHSEALNYLEGVLQGTIMWVGDQNRFMLRHKILADYMIKNCASLELLKESYIRVLSVLAPELKKSHGPSKKFNLFKALVNHKILYYRFKRNIEQAREVYDSITTYFSDDAHFWLQYGSLEIEGKGGDLDLAENYLSQAESLSPDSPFIQNAICNLLYKQAFAASNKVEAFEYKLKADQMAQGLLLVSGEKEPYTFHIYCSGRYKFITRWVTNSDDKKREMSDLKTSIQTALSYHPFNDKLKVASLAINRAHLQLGINEDLQDPPIPDFADS